jgi:hypothetical protein
LNIIYFLGVLAARVDVVDNNDTLDPVFSASVLVLDLPTLDFF